MTAFKKLISNSAIFAVGNLGSKIISILLVPLYTYYLTPSEYGMIDLITVTSSLVLPLLTLSIYDAVLRFIMDKNQKKEVIFSNGLIITVLGTIVVLSIYIVLNFFNTLEGLLNFLCLIVISQSFQTLCAQFARATGRIKTYAVNGILMALVIGISNIIFLVKFNLGIDGYFYSIIAMNLVSIIYFNLTLRIYKYANFKHINYYTIKEMLVYSVPLIPNALMWWLMNTSNRFFILLFVGIGANGLFAVANKIPSLLSILNSFFFQAWQLSAIEEYESKNKSEFYSRVFYFFSMVMFLGTSAIIVILKPTLNLFVDQEFFQAWIFVPFLLLGNVFASFSGFIGTHYIAAKKTNGVFITSIIGGIVSIIANIIFIPIIGAVGASLSTMISFFTIWILRISDTKKYVDMKIDIKNIVLNILVIVIQTFVLFLYFNTWYELVIELILFSILILLNIKLFSTLNKILMSFLAKKKFD